MGPKAEIDTNPDRSAMTPAEWRATLQLASLYGLRMLGLFMVIPVLAPFAEELPGATPLGIGLAVGVYGLTQALLQIPFGMASDRLGRHRVLVAGLLIFAAGSALAASATHIATLIVGRALQGAGAISAVLTALLSDLTRASQRTKAMAVVGVTIGAAFSLAMIAGPILAQWWGISGLFLVSCGMALAGLVVLGRIPAPPIAGRQRRSRPTLHRALGVRALWQLNLGIFSLHLLLTATFVATPLILRDDAALAVAGHWKIYLPVMIAALLTMVPLVMASQRIGARPLLLAAIIVLGAAEAGMSTGSGSLTLLITMLWLFFTAFNLLEAMLPSLVTQVAPQAHRGIALGTYSTAQFLGAFAGGLLGGAMLGWSGPSGVFTANAAIAALWLLASVGFRVPSEITAH